MGIPEALVRETPANYPTPKREFQQGMSEGSKRAIINRSAESGGKHGHISVDLVRLDEREWNPTLDEQLYALFHFHHISSDC